MWKTSFLRNFSKCAVHSKSLLFENLPGPKSLPVIGSLHNYLPLIGKHSFVFYIIHKLLLFLKYIIVNLIRVCSKMMFKAVYILNYLISFLLLIYVFIIINYWVSININLTMCSKIGFKIFSIYLEISINFFYSPWWKIFHNPLFL